jgi:hypothetical protein
MALKKKRLTLDTVKSVTKSSIIQEEVKVKLKDLERFSKSIRFPLLWKEEIEGNIDYPIDLSSFIVEAIKEKMEREEMNTFIG